MKNPFSSLKLLYFFVYGDLRQDNNIKNNKYISDGGSNIHINFILRIVKKVGRIDLVTFKNNYQLDAFFGQLNKIHFEKFKTLSNLFHQNLLRLETLTRCFYPGLLYLLIKREQTHVFTATDFLPDSLAGFLTKIRNPQIIWVASFFLKAPFPFFNKNFPYRGKRWIIGFFYWLLQKPSYFFINRLADIVLVTSQPDVKLFTNSHRDTSKIIVVQGGVNIEESKTYLKSDKVLGFNQKKYDAVFMGRFHPQKGVLGLINIWNLVVQKNKSAQLLLIGDGPLKNDVLRKIKECRLNKNITLVGIKDGQEKFDLFKQSKIVVHPATYDSGGMASAEAMAWGLPGVSFDLESLRTYYPKGMIKTKCFDHNKFSENILKLLSDSNLYKKTSQEAVDLIQNVWDWEKRVDKVYNQIFSNG